jgi:hypothetical protein
MPNQIARDSVSSWLVSNMADLGLSQLKLERIDNSHTNALSAWYESPALLVDVMVWEHSYCLDILVLSKITGEQLFSAAGSCQSVAGLAERLGTFASWLSENRAVA